MSDKFTVAYILDRFPHLTETFILREMLQLRASGMQVHVFSLLSPLNHPVHDEAREMLPYVHYSTFLSWKILLAQLYFLLHVPFKYIGALWRAITETWREPSVLLRALSIFPKSVYFAREMQAIEVDHIHAHFVWINGIAAQVISDLTGITFSLHPHAFGLFMRNQQDVKRQLELADGIVTVSEYHRHYIAGLAPRWKPADIAVVHYGLDPTGFAFSRTPANDDGIRIISVGSLTEKKGHAYLIDACAELLKRNVPFRCLIVGSGPLREPLHARIERLNLQDCVSLAGPKTQTEVKALYRQSDLFVLACVVARSGDRDGMPNVLLEAMAMALPVVTTPVTGIPELVRDGETGLLVPERDSLAVAQALERLIENAALRRRLGQKGRQAVLDGFDIHATAAELAMNFQVIHARRGKSHEKAI